MNRSNILDLIDPRELQSNQEASEIPREANSPEDLALAIKNLIERLRESNPIKRIVS